MDRTRLIRARLDHLYNPFRNMLLCKYPHWKSLVFSALCNLGGGGYPSLLNSMSSMGSPARRGGAGSFRAGLARLHFPALDTLSFVMKSEFAVEALVSFSLALDGVRFSEKPGMDSTSYRGCGSESGLAAGTCAGRGSLHGGQA